MIKDPSKEEIENNMAMLSGKGRKWNVHMGQPFYEVLYKHVWKPEALKGLRDSNLDSFFYTLARCGPRLLSEREVWPEVEKWWYKQPHNTRAKKNIQRVGEALLLPDSGRKSDVDKNEAIAEDFLKWESVIKQINKDLKCLLKQHTSWQQAPREVRENIIDDLARKHSLAVDSVKTILRILQTSARRIDKAKATPTEATSEFVAGLYDVSAKTVEALARDFLNRHPLDRQRREQQRLALKSKQESPTTQADERTV
jgi:hypothetical protein